MHAFRDNRVVRDTGALYPILQSPMSWIARSSLVSADAAESPMHGNYKQGIAGAASP